MIADRFFRDALLQSLNDIMYQATACAPSDEVYLTIRSTYESAIAFVGIHERNPERVIHELDQRFERCDPRMMFVYDHIKECVKRGLLLTFEEYAELARRFPRCR